MRICPFLIVKKNRRYTGYNWRNNHQLPTSDNDNAHLFKLPNYNCIYKHRKIKGKGGVAIYIPDNIQYILREDLSIFIEGEFESIFIESINNSQTSIVGVKYRIPNTNVNLSIQRYQAILDKTESANSQVIIGTDHNFDYLKINSYKSSTDLLHLYLAINIIPTITKPTRITHISANFIDNVYVRDTTQLFTLVYYSAIYVTIYLYSVLSESGNTQRNVMSY